MADDVPVTPSASYTVAADVLTGIAYQRVKVQVGADGVVGDVDVTNPFPVLGTVQVSGAVQISGAVSISVMPAVSGTVTVGTVIGTQVVSVVPGVSVNVGQLANAVVTTTASSGQSGQVVWLGQNQATVTITGVSIGISGPVSISVMPAVSISVSAVLGTVITVLGAVNVSGVVSVSVLPAVSISVSAVLGTVVTLLGTVLASIVQPVIVTFSNQFMATGPQAASSSAMVVVPKDYTRIPFQIIVSSTIAGASSTFLMTVYTNNTIATTGASFMVFASRMRVLSMNVVAVSSVVQSMALIGVLYAVAAVSLSVTATVGIGAIIAYLPAATSFNNLQGLALDGAPAATTVGVGLIQGTSHTVQAIVISGFLF